MSTTAMLRKVLDRSGGHVGIACGLLIDWAHDSEAATCALRVLRMKAKKHQGSTHFSMDRNGFVRMQSREAA